MSKNKNRAWQTKYGPRRVRNEAPTLDEAIVAAECLSDKLDEQAEIAAALMGMPFAEVHAELLKRATPAKLSLKTVVRTTVFSGSPSAPRSVVVERKPARRIIATEGRTFGRSSQTVIGGR